MPTAVVASEGVDLVHDHHAQVREQAAGIDVRRHQHHLQRLRRGQQAVGRVAEHVPAGGGGHVAVPEGRTPAQERAVPLEPHVEVVQEGLDRADVEHAQPRPALRQHARGHGQEGRLRLAARRGRQHDHVLPGENAGDHLLLEGSQLPPTQAVDDVVLQRRMELIEVAHKFSSISSTSAAPIACRSTGVSSVSATVRA